MFWDVTAAREAVPVLAYDVQEACCDNYPDLPSDTCKFHIMVDRECVLITFKISSIHLHLRIKNVC